MIAENLAINNLNMLYNEICFAENINNNVKNPKTAKMLIDWKKKWSKTSNDKAKVDKTLKRLAELLGNNSENTDLMDRITSYFIILSKNVNDEANDELSKILGEIE
jgi:hypothetical protein